MTKIKKKPTSSGSSSSKLFYADRKAIGRNATLPNERKLTFDAAVICWDGEDIGEITRDESGVNWGWKLTRYSS